MEFVGRGFAAPFFYLLSRLMISDEVRSNEERIRWEEPFLIFTHTIPERTRQNAGLSGACAGCGTQGEVLKKCPDQREAERQFIWVLQSLISI